MTPLSRCDLRDCSPRVLGFWSVVGVLALAVLAGVLAVGHVQLRFITRDFQIETHKLQKVRASLGTRKATLKAEIERMRRYDGNIEEFAKEAGLAVCPADRKSTAAISAESVERWQALARAADAPKAQELPRTVQVAGLVQRLLSWSTPILAREIEDRRDAFAPAGQN